MRVTTIFYLQITHDDYSSCLYSLESGTSGSMPVYHTDFKLAASSVYIFGQQRDPVLLIQQGPIILACFFCILGYGHDIGLPAERRQRVSITLIGMNTVAITV